MKPSKTARDIGVLISTHDRVVDARVNLELIRNVWGLSGLFRSIRIVHAYNGRREWYPKKTKEDVLIRRPNPGHFQGAAGLLDAGLEAFRRCYPSIEYVVALAADTWVVKPIWIARTIERMANEQRPFASSAWGLLKQNELFDVGVATDCFIVHRPWAHRYHLFPLRYAEFVDRYGEVFLYRSGCVVSLEKLFLTRFFQAVTRSEPRRHIRRQDVADRLLRLRAREPVHLRKDRAGRWIRKHWWPIFGLITHHDPAEKARLLRRLGLLTGREIRRFLSHRSG